MKFLTQRAMDAMIDEAYDRGRNDERASNIKSAIEHIKELEAMKVRADKVIGEGKSLSVDDFREQMTMRGEV